MRESKTKLKFTRAPSGLQVLENYKGQASTKRERDPTTRENSPADTMTDQRTLIQQQDAAAAPDNIEGVS
jgi:hypothetical protein